MRRCHTPPYYCHHQRLFASVCGLALCLVSGAGITRPAPAQDQGIDAGTTALQPATGDFRSYRIRHVEAERVRQELSAMLSAIADPGEVVIDRETNRLFVRGSDRVHGLTQQVIHSLDRAPAAEPPLREGSAATHPETSVLRAYPMLPSHEPQISELERQLAARNDVRLARDARTGQLLVLAPESIHARFGEILSLPANSGRAAENAPQSSPVGNPNGQAHQPDNGEIPTSSVFRGTDSAPRYSPVPANEQGPGALSRRVLHLRALSVDDVHARLERLMGQPLPLYEDATRLNVQFGIEAAPGARVSVSAERQSGQITVIGRADLADSWAKVISALDAADQPNQPVTRLVATRNAQKDHLRLVAQTLSAQPPRQPSGRPVTLGATRPGQGQLVTMLFQPDADAAQLQAPVDGQEPPANQLDVNGQEGPPSDVVAAAVGLIGQVQIEYIEGLDILIIRGNERDVEQVRQLIEEIERRTVEAPLEVVVHELQHVQSQALAELITQVYTDVLTPRQGAVSITSLVKPNALLLIGRVENVQSVIDLIEKLDTESLDPSAQFEVFFLRHAGALDAQNFVQQFFPLDEATGLATRVLAIADFRSNALVVRAAPRDMEEIRELINRLDTNRAEGFMEVRTFLLRNSLATELAEVLLNALTTQGQVRTQGGGQGGQQGGFQQPGGGQGAGQQINQPRSVQMVVIDTETNRQVESGILTDVRINADSRSNALVVTAPRDSMGLIAALIQQLDRVPAAEAQLKVFTIENGDATSLVEMLETLFGQPTGGGGGGGGQQGPGFGGIGGGDSSLVQLRFSVDERTNSIIASGTQEDLAVVYAILLRLDEEDVRGRESRVFRLKNAFAPDVATALTTWLTGERDIQQIAPGAVSTVEQIEREAVIVPEEASNSLIVSATRSVFDEIEEIIREIDEQPPMVEIQVLIAEVALNDTDEFGVELGLQDSILFDRSLLEILNTTTNTTTTQTPGGATTTFQEQVIQSANITPGFLFNNPSTSLGNAGSSRALATSGKVGTQGLSNFGVGRINGELGFGGFVFSAGSENLNILLRALQESRRLEVLSRPHITAIDNQFAVVRVGQLVPVIQSAQINETGQINTTTLQEVGLILRVQPRVSPDGLVVMRIEAEKSEVGPEEEGIPVSISATGQVVRSPRINQTFAATTVHALSGQTILLGGLISKSKTDIHRRVPLIADIPLIGDLFRYDSVSEGRAELLIIMTPRVIRNFQDAEMVKQVESSRMTWVLSDVVALHGPAGLRGRTDHWGDEECEALYPTYVPADGEIVLPPSGGQPQETPMPHAAPVPQSPLPEPAQQEFPGFGRYEQIEYQAAPAVYHGAASGQAQQTGVYDRLIPLPPTR